MTEPSDLLGIDYDRTSRHRLLADLVTELLPAGASVLDVGGAEGLTAPFLPGHRVVTVDVATTSNVDIGASAGSLPFRDGSFDAVAGLDVLEHVPAATRPGVLSEAARVSRELVVFAGPYGDAAVTAGEARVQDFFVNLFGTPNRWLAEHDACGLPDLEACAAVLRSHGLTVSSFGSNPLRLWTRLQMANFTAARLDAVDQHAETNRRLFADLIPRADALPPTYRHFVVATRSGRRPGGREPASDAELTVERWERDLEAHLAALVDGAVRRLTAHSADLEQGWRESARRSVELEAELASCTARSVDLERGWKQAAHRADTAQRTMYAYEQALFRVERDWREPVRGPAIAGGVAVRGCDPEQYGRWIAARPAHPPPATGVRFSVLTPVFDPDSRFLEACIRSVRAQTHDDWQLVLVDVSTAPHVAPICRRFAQADSRVTVVQAENRGIAANTNLAAEHANGDWLVFLDHDDEVAPHALAALGQAITADPTADIVYSDEDKLDADGRRVDPFFKPAWSPDLLRMVNYIGHAVAIRRSLFDAVGGLREGFEGAQDFDLLLRVTAVAQRVVHVPDVLYHWRRHAQSTAVAGTVKPDAHAAGRRALQDFADRWVPGAWIDIGSGPTTHRLRYPRGDHKVSVIIPFRDAPELTDACLEAISARFNATPFEVLLVSNQSREEKTFALMDAWEQRYAWARCLHYDHPFNFHALNNWAAARAEGTLLLFLNNDTQALHDGWIDGLAEHAQRPEVGVVGPRLFYPDGRVQHAGVAVGIGGFADHPWQDLHPDSWTEAGPSYWLRNFLSVTAACMMIERAKFEEVGGFDERFQVCGGDVDLGLRLHRAGYWNVMTPFVRLVHHESATRQRQPPEGDVIQSRRAYAPYLGGGDPFYNLNLTRADTSCGIGLP